MENTTMNTTNPIVGLRLLRKSNILAVVAVTLAIVGSITMVITGGVGLGMAMEGGTSLVGGMMIAAAIGGLVAFLSAIAILVASIMEIVALVKISSAHAWYKTALIWLVVSFIFSSVVSLLPLSGVAISVLNAGAPILGMLKVYFVIGATLALLGDGGDAVAIAKGSSVRNIYIVCTLIMVVADLAALVPALAALADVVTVVTSAVQLVALFKFIGFLGSAVKAFEA